MIYLDTNVFVFAALGNKKAKDILAGVITGKITAATSTATWDEVVWAIKKTTQDYEFAKIEGKRLLNLNNIPLLDLTVTVLEKSQWLIEEYNLKPRDAIHIASALIGNITTIISDDADLDRVKNIKRISINNFNP